MRLIHKVSFPGAIYRKKRFMEIFIATDTASV
jgi:hypothetical protein